jgi:hypothetical protein
MGADERPGICQTCKGDLDGNGWIMVSDLSMLVGILNQSGPPYEVGPTGPLYNDCGDVDDDRWITLTDYDLPAGELEQAGPPYQIQCP